MSIKSKIFSSGGSLLLKQEAPLKTKTFLIGALSAGFISANSILTFAA